MSWVGWVAHVILVSAQGPNPSFFLFWGDFYSTWDKGLDSDLDQGLTIWLILIEFFLSIGTEEGGKFIMNWDVYLWTYWEQKKSIDLIKESDISPLFLFGTRTLGLDLDLCLTKIYILDLQSAGLSPNLTRARTWTRAWQLVEIREITSKGRCSN